MHLLRGGILLTALIAVPGAAVCWNLLPKAFSSYEESERFDVETSNKADFSEEKNEEKVPGPPDGSSSDVETRPTTEVVSTKNIRRMGGEPDGSHDRLIPDAFSGDKAVWAADNATPYPKIARQVEPTDSTDDAQSFSSLEGHLKQLGAKYYRLEKWGDRGELFRFSCYVSSSGVNRYQKHFQAIGPDELQVMKHVIRDIERWKHE